MKRFFTAVSGFFILLACVAVVCWHSLCIMVANWTGRLQRSMVNQRLHRGSIQLLKLIAADYSISFVPGFAMKKATPYIFMANHLSLFDLPLLYATIPGTIRFLVKKSLFKTPLFGNALSNSDFVSVDIGNPSNMQELFNEAKATLNKDVTLFIFPEGMRSLTGELTTLKAGGFRLALEVGAHIIPIGIRGTDKALPPRTLQLKRGQHFTIKVGTPIDSRKFNGIGSQKLLMLETEEAIKKLC